MHQVLVLWVRAIKKKKSELPNVVSSHKKKLGVVLLFTLPMICATEALSAQTVYTHFV